ncbi:MAG: ribonuclease domain-containing protein [Pirellulales bacterium]
MARSRSSKSYGRRRRGLPTWITVIATLAAIGLLYWFQGPADHPWKPLPVDPQKGTAGRPDGVRVSAEKGGKNDSGRGGAEGESNQKKEGGRKKGESDSATTSSERTIVKNVTIRDRSGDEAYQGDIDLTDTLKRIDRGERLEFPHDGTVFQNREGRLPEKPAEHYREWVHRTPGMAGPGPQRVVTGEDGEAYYTHDHYETFKRIR